MQPSRTRVGRSQRCRIRKTSADAIDRTFRFATFGDRALRMRPASRIAERYAAVDNFSERLPTEHGSSSIYNAHVRRRMLGAVVWEIFSFAVE